MTDQFNPKHGPVTAIPFAKSNLTTGESNTDLVLAGTGTLVCAPKAGSVVGLSLRATAAITAGTITARTHKAGTEFAETGYPSAVLSSTARESYAVVRPRALRFAAGDTLGLSVTTTTTLDPTDTNDVDALLFVVFDPD